MGPSLALRGADLFFPRKRHLRRCGYIPGRERRILESQGSHALGALLTTTCWLPIPALLSTPTFCTLVFEFSSFFP